MEGHKTQCCVITMVVGCCGYGGQCDIHRKIAAGSMKRAGSNASNLTSQA